MDGIHCSQPRLPRAPTEFGHYITNSCLFSFLNERFIEANHTDMLHFVECRNQYSNQIEEFYNLKHHKGDQAQWIVNNSNQSNSVPSPGRILPLSWLSRYSNPFQLCTFSSLFMSEVPGGRRLSGNNLLIHQPGAFDQFKL